MNQMVRLLLGRSAVKTIQEKSSAVSDATNHALKANAEVRRDLLEIRALERTSRGEQTLAIAALFGLNKRSRR